MATSSRSGVRRTSRPTAAALALAAVVVVAAALLGPASGDPSTGPAGPVAPTAVPPPPASPTSADQIQNIDQVKTAIKGYYGDQPDPDTTNPVTGARDLRTYSRDGAYARETRALGRETRELLRGERARGEEQAIVLDVDDTSLSTYNYEVWSGFVYNPSSNAAFVNAGVFPKVPGMVGLAHEADALGYTVFFLTGRPESQRSATVENLTDAGYPAVPDEQVFLKDLGRPIYASCAPSCTTTQYKSLTREYIESEGYDIVVNAGDQRSDLRGGFADHRVKVPNPMYYLP